VTKSNNKQYLAEDFDLWDWKLTDDEMNTLTEATAPSGTHSNCLA
jgi:diketogulonate reductase-like aldo/keto reductase